MTIEEKAKAYDKAIKKAESLYKVAEPMSGCNVIIETLFPSIKESEESEDEKIIKALIQLVRDYPSMDFFIKYDIHLYEIINWLEKQSKQNYKIIKGRNYLCLKTHNYAGVEWIKDTKYYASDNNTLVNQGCEYYWPEYSKEEHNNLFEEVK